MPTAKLEESPTYFQTLSHDGLSQLLEELAADGATGAVDIELSLGANAAEKTIYLVGGNVAGAVSNDPVDDPATWFLGRRLLTRAQLDAGFHIARRTDRSLVDVLHKTGAVADEDLEAFVIESTMDIVLGTFLWSEGFIRYRSGARLSVPLSELSLDIEGLVLEGARWRSVATELRQRLPDTDARLVLLPGSSASPNGDSVDARLRELLVVPHTLNELRHVAHIPELKLLDWVARQLDAGAIGCKPPGLDETRPGADEIPIGLERESVEELVSAPVDVDNRADEMLHAARGAMDLERYEEALELFRSAELAAPSDPRYRMLRESAETVYAEIAARRTAAAPA